MALKDPDKRREYNRDYRRKNPDKAKAWAKKYNSKNSKKLAITHKAWYHKNLEKARAMFKDWRDRNPEKRLRIKKKWYATHPEQYLKERRIRKERLLNIEYEQFDIPLIMEEATVCAWCLRKLESGHKHLDHIIPLCKGGSHTRKNVCVSCDTCNLSKGGKLPEDFVIYQHKHFDKFFSHLRAN